MNLLSSISSGWGYLQETWARDWGEGRGAVIVKHSRVSIELAALQLTQAVADLPAQLLGLGNVSCPPCSCTSSPPGLCVLVQGGVCIPGKGGPGLRPAPRSIESKDDGNQSSSTSWRLQVVFRLPTSHPSSQQPVLAQPQIQEQ